MMEYTANKTNQTLNLTYVKRYIQIFTKIATLQESAFPSFCLSRPIYVS